MRNMHMSATLQESQVKDLLLNSKGNSSNVLTQSLTPIGEEVTANGGRHTVLGESINSQNTLLSLTN